MGIDSLMAAQFRNMVRDELGIELPFGRLLEGATLLDIVQVLVAKLQTRATEPSHDAPAVRSAAGDARGLDAVSAEATFDLELETGEV